MKIKLRSQSCSLFSLFCLSLLIGQIEVHPAQAQDATNVAPATVTEAPAETPATTTITSDGVVVDAVKKDEAKVSEQAPEIKILKSIEVEVKKKKGNEIFERSSIASLVFQPAQYALLREARIGFNARIPTLQELAKAGDPNDPNYRAPAVLRDLRLGGIAFNTPDDWTIWLNNSRVTPDALPSEALDLRVYKDFIEVKWFDAMTNQVFPIRLRTNQRFNLDSRIFLPGI